MEFPDPTLLKTALSAAVPLWIARLRQESLATLQYQTSDLAQLVAEKGDRLMFRSKKGETADVFNALAKGIAICAFAPGGITTFGLHFEAQHPDGGVKEDDDSPHTTD